MNNKESLKTKLSRYIIAGFDNAYWYEHSNASIQRFAIENGYCFSRVLNYAAILSPRVQVSRSVTLTKQLLKGNTTGIMTQRLQAIELWERTGKLSTGSIKVRAFRDSLELNPLAVCIDVHMSSIIMGEDIKNKSDLMKNDKKNRKKRESFQRIILRLGKRFGLTGPQTQAAIWCGKLRIENNYSDERIAPLTF